MGLHRYTWEEIIATPLLTDTIRNADVVVEGPFIMAQKDPDLLFRGSANQRIIDIQESLASSKIILWQ